MAMRWMQAASIDAFGGEVHMLKRARPGPPAPDELVISVRAAGIGNWDEIVRIGEWDVGRKPPLVLGVEAAGVVAAVGDDVSNFEPQDEVLTHPLPLRHQGTWAQLLLAPAALVAPKPAGVPWETAAAFPVPALTADQALAEAAPSPAVADGGRLATITGDPPTPERGLTVTNVYVEADGKRLAALAEALKEGLLSLKVGAIFALADAATALHASVTGRAAGATVLTLDQSPSRSTGPLYGRRLYWQQ